MKLREDDTMDPQVERELAAIDAALRGEAVDHDLADLAELSSDLTDLRQTPGEDFSAGMDRDVAAGFESGERPVAAVFDFKGLWEKFRAESLTRRLLPVGAVAATAVVVVTAVVAAGGGSSDDSFSGSDTAALDQTTSSSSAASGGAAGSSDESTIPTLAAPPSTATDSASAQSAQKDYIEALPVEPTIRSKSATGPFASDQNHRSIERDAQLTLGTGPEKVQDVSDDVLGVVGRYDGIVLDSSIEDGPAGDAGAAFELLIPSNRLGDALADLSGVAEVRSREENTKDITAPTVSTQDHLKDARAEVQGLLKQLANADTDAERESAEQQLSFQRQRIAGLRSTLSNLERRANLSHVSLDIVTGDASTFGDSSDDGQWTVGDALNDAGDILGTAAGVTLIGLAILAPFALLALLIWLARRGWISGSRRRALEG